MTAHYLIIHFHRISHISNITSLYIFSVNLSYEVFTLSPWQHHSNVKFKSYIFQETRSWCQEGLRSTDKDLIPWTIHMEQIDVGLFLDCQPTCVQEFITIFCLAHFSCYWLVQATIYGCLSTCPGGLGLCLKCNSEPMALSVEINNFKFMSDDLVACFSEYLLSLAVWRAWRKAWSKWEDVLGSFESHSRLIEVKFVADDLLFYELYWQCSLQTWAGLLIRGDAEEE